MIRRPHSRKPYARGTASQTTTDSHDEARNTSRLAAALDGASVEFSRAEDSSVAGDAATLSGVRSVSTFQTFSSHDTVKASNKRIAPPIPLRSSTSSKGSESNISTKQTSRWKNIKKAMAIVKASSMKEGLLRRSPTKENEGLSSDDPPPAPPLQQRSRSAGSTSAADTANLTENSEVVDQLTKGRLDGLDVLSLGSAFCRIHKLPRDPNNSGSPWDHWMESCIGASQTYDSSEMVAHMLRTSGGQSPPNIVLEGFVESDRWSLRIEEGPIFSSNSNEHCPSLNYSDTPPPPLLPVNSSSEEEDGGSPDLPTRKLWSTLWGPEPAPASSLPTLEEVEVNSEEEDDPLLDLAAESSVPIDVDEDTFIVSTPEHLDVINGIASVSIAAGRFAPATRVLTKLVLGLDSSTSEKHIKDNLRGSACHNIGLLYMWQGDFEDALHFFTQAVVARESTRLASKRDVAVTLVRKGHALFALNRHREALESFETALASTEEDTVVRAKILNNVGVAQYHLRDLAKALQSFTNALTIQRKWLDGPVRREPLVYDASVTLENMGKLYIERGDNGMASFVYEEALLLQKSVFRKEHPIVLTGLRNLAFSKARQFQIPKAVKILERCRRIQVDLYGTSSAAVIETCGWMAHLCARSNKIAKAQPLYKAVHAWQKACLPAEHAARKRVRACLDMLPTGENASLDSPTSTPAFDHWI